MGGHGALFSSFALIFLAELGDKTQLALIALVAGTGELWSVFIGGTLALWAVSLIGILLGSTVLRLIPKAWMHRAAAVLFPVIGVLAAGAGLLDRTELPGGWATASPAPDYFSVELPAPPDSVCSLSLRSAFGCYRQQGKAEAPRTDSSSSPHAAGDGARVVPVPLTFAALGPKLPLRDEVHPDRPRYTDPLSCFAATPMRQPPSARTAT